MTLNVCWPHLHQPLQSLAGVPSFHLPSAATASALPLVWRLCPRPPLPCVSPSSRLKLLLCHSSAHSRLTRWESFLFLSRLCVGAGRDGPSKTQGPPSRAPLPLPGNVGIGGGPREVLCATLHQVAVTEDPWAEGALFLFCAGWGLLYMEPGSRGKSFD